MVRICRFALYNICRIRSFLTKDATQLLVQALVILPQLSSGLPASQVERIPNQCQDSRVTLHLQQKPKDSLVRTSPRPLQHDEWVALFIKWHDSSRGTWLLQTTGEDTLIVLIYVTLKTHLWPIQSRYNTFIPYVLLGIVSSVKRFVHTLNALMPWTSDHVRQMVETGPESEEGILSSSFGNKMKSNGRK